MAYAEGISVSQSLDEDNIAFSDSVKFEIVLQWDGPQTAYFFDKPLNPQIEGLKVRRFASSVGSDLTAGKEITTKKFLYVLEPVTSGMGRIAPLEISYFTWPDSLPGRLVTEAMAVTIAPPRTVDKARQSFWWIWLVLIVAVVGSAIVIAIAIVRQKRRPVAVAKSPLESLNDGLSEAVDLFGSDFKKFQTEVHRLLLDFLHRQFDIDGADLSEDELKQRLSAAGLEDSKAQAVCDWLIRAQRDKYSPVTAGPGETVRLGSELKDFFEKLEI
ncbi:MAG: hypothetical protein JSU74_07495 [Candidatus Zixiibacteriota bacterium]|nr:MAG: hypothetical protein JSU74_07495 [candidate division Zixibacteria bacterium]